MSDEDTLVFETILEAPPEKVWRALTIPEFRDRWLQLPSDVSLHLVGFNVNSLLAFSWKERNEESLVTVELSPQDNGHTGFRLTHSAPVTLAPANSNETLALAA